MDNSKPAELSFAGIRIPLAVQNPERVMLNPDMRTVTVEGGGEAELVDLKALKSVYRYAHRGGLISPEAAGGNMILNIQDSDPGETVFYRVIVNGADLGRTETGPAEIPLSFRGNVRPDSYNRIEIERWHLNRARERYERENNIRQPGPLKIFFPDGNVIRIQLFFSDGKYEISSSLFGN